MTTMQTRPDVSPRPAERVTVPVFDCDGHVAEPRSLWDDYCEPAYRAAANEALYIKNFSRGGSGLMVNGECLLIGVEAVTFAGQSPMDFAGRHWDEGYVGAFDPAHRLGDMDLEGIDQAMVFPSMVGALGGVHDPQLAAAMARAYNRWILEYCATDPNRLYGVAVAPLQDPVAAAAEVEWAAVHGFRCVMVRPTRYDGATLDRPAFEPFLAACEHHGIVLGLHPFPFADVQWTQPVLPDLAAMPGSALEMADLACLPFDNMLTMAYLMFGGVCDRHPNLKISFLESNGTWVAFWLDRMDSRFHRRTDRPITTPPSEILARQCFVSVEGDERGLTELAGVIGEDVIIWASDFPHFDGHFPGAVTEVLDGMANAPESLLRKVLGENAARMYSLPLGR